MEIPTTNDLTQEGKKIQIPEIRVWCHPHYIKKDGDDYYYVFETFKEAERFISKHKEAEEIPLIAFRGYEINLYDIKAKAEK